MAFSPSLAMRAAAKERAKLEVMTPERIRVPAREYHCTNSNPVPPGSVHPEEGVNIRIFHPDAVSLKDKTGRKHLKCPHCLCEI